METTKITISASISADIQKTWNYYTLPAHITKWNFASDDWHCPSASNDMQVGGKYIGRMEAKDGSFGFDFEAIYSEIKPYEHFTYLSEDDRQIDVFFKSNAGNTEITITFDAENENPIELQQQGWQAILNNFKKYIEAN